MNSLEYLGAIGVGKGWMISYRHMCRWNSGFFYRHPRLAEFDWYWRVEPDVRGASAHAPNQHALTASIRSTFSVTSTTMYFVSCGTTD